MAYLLFIGWFVLLYWVLTQSALVMKALPDKRVVFVLFFCKVMMGVLAGWLLESPVPNSDTWWFHHDGITEYKLLFHHPKEYFTNIFDSGYPDAHGGFLRTQNSYWNDLKTNLIIKFLSILDIFSFGKYYVNVVLFNFLLFWGWSSLVLFFKSIFAIKRELIYIGVFLLPSTIFYCSTIHKDGIMLSMLGVFLYNIWLLVYTRKKVFLRLLYVLLSLICLLLFRTYLVFALIPAVASYLIASWYKRRPLLTFAFVYTIAISLFFTLVSFWPSVDLPGYVVSKQADFIALGKANTSIPIRLLHPTFASFLDNLPQAICHGFFRPFFGDIKLSIKLLPFAFELLGYLVLVTSFLIFPRKKGVIDKAGSFMLLFFSISVCLFIGYTVPVLGAIVRYRSLLLPFLIVPLLANINWLKIKEILKIKK